jgi:hypothetical protein
MEIKSSIRVDTVEEDHMDDDDYESYVDVSWNIYNFEDDEDINYNIPTPKSAPTDFWCPVLSMSRERYKDNRQNDC